MRLAAIVLSLGLACGTAAQATVYAPVDEATLAGASPTIVTGNVVSSGPRRIPGGIVTDTAVAVDHVFKGAVGSMIVTVTTPGGRIDDDRVVVFGMPSFRVGEDVLLYLQQAPDGDGRVGDDAAGNAARTAGDDVARDDRGRRAGQRRLVHRGVDGGMRSRAAGKAERQQDGRDAHDPAELKWIPVLAPETGIE
jgi:hypothetical protein